jgi:Xaa-Pro aminopeptidase
MSDFETHATRLQALRDALSAQGLDGFIVPRTNTHQLEYVPACDERMMWLTGFTGTAGTAVILATKAVLITDGRYALQAEHELDQTLFEIAILPDVTLETWVKRHVPALTRLGYDPDLHTPSQIEKLTKAAGLAGVELIALSANPIDALWINRPAPPCAPVEIHDLIFAGESHADKLARLHTKMAEENIAFLLISDPHNLAWLFNIRGADIPHTPLCLGYAIIPRDEKPTLFIHPAKLFVDICPILEEAAYMKSPDALKGELEAICAQKIRIRCDTHSVSSAFAQTITAIGCDPDLGEDPITLMKAIKNTTEIQGARNAHIRDGAALCRFLMWLEDASQNIPLDEMRIAQQLLAFRKDTGLLRDLSFPTIAGTGANGAIVHYRASLESSRVWGDGEILLLDSGAQYRDGTTDITRTLVRGTPSDEMKDHYTRVLKGHIAIAQAVFPQGTTGAQLDTLARQFLWQIGCDYDHGTGHGVGSYLSVHEGPQRISKLGKVPLEAGMILSNEPGYYKTGAYGIRLENLILVREHHIENATRPMLAFETLTLCPFDRRLIDTALLTQAERDWLNAYHHNVYKTLSLHLDAASTTWLKENTDPL